MAGNGVGPWTEEYDDGGDDGDAAGVHGDLSSIYECDVSEPELEQNQQIYV